MDENRGNSVGDNMIIIEEEGRINQLPDILLCEILKNLPTKDVITSSLLCRRWRNLWRYVPALDLDLVFYGTVKDYTKFNFLNSFIDFNKDLLLHRVKLRNVGYGCDDSFATTTRTLFRQKIQHIDVYTKYWFCSRDMRVEIPPTFYTHCERLVSLKLNGASLPKTPETVSLPCLKMMDLEDVLFVDYLGMEILISCVEYLTISYDILTGLANYSYGLNFWDVPHCVSSSLEFVEVKAKDMTLSMKNLGSYFVSNSTLLKKLTLWVDHMEIREPVILDELFALPRRSNTCKVVVRSGKFGTYIHIPS